MRVGVFSSYGRVGIMVPEEDFSYCGHYSFFDDYFSFMYFEVAIAADIG
jgi:hypothetical protein